MHSDGHGEILRELDFDEPPFPQTRVDNDVTEEKGQLEILLPSPTVNSSLIFVPTPTATPGSSSILFDVEATFLSLSVLIDILTFDLQ